MRYSAVNKNRTKSIQTILRVLAVVVFLFAGTPVAADEYDDQIAELNRQIAANQSQANHYRAQANTLNNRIAALNAEISASQVQLRRAQAQSAKLAAEIAAAEAKLAENKAVLAENLSLIYREGQVSSLEALISSDSLSDFFNKQQYLEELRTKVQSSLEEIAALKTKLEEERKKEQAVIAEQQAITSNLAKQRGQVNGLLVQTRGEEAKYQAVIAADKARVAQLRAAQAEMLSRIKGDSGGGSIGEFQYRNFRAGGQCGGGYGFDPIRGMDYCAYAPDSVVDRWDLYNRECVSYAAWAVTYRFGKNVPEFNGNGHAYQWPSYLGARGYRVNSTPAVGSVMVMPREMIGGVGHVAVVEQVLGDGWVKVSQYNMAITGPWHMYSTMEVKVVSGLKFIHF